MATLSHNFMAQDGTSLKQGTLKAGKGNGHPILQCHGPGWYLSNKVLPKRGKELATLPHNAVAQDGTSLQQGAPKARKGTGHPTSQCRGSGWYLSPTRCSQSEERNWPPYLTMSWLRMVPISNKVLSNSRSTLVNRFDVKCSFSLFSQKR